MKNLGSIFIAFALFCFVVLSSCQGSGTSSETEDVKEESEELVEETGEAIDEVVDSAATIVEDESEVE